MAKNGNTKTPATIDPDYGDIPADVLELIGKSKPLAYSTKREDNVIPLIRLLQKGSPQVDQRGSDSVAGAGAGDFWFKNAEQEIVKGDLGFNFWPLGYHKNYVEWRPARGGYAGAHAEPPPEASWRVDKADNGRERRVLGLKNGNYLEETAYHYGLVNNSVWVLPFRSAGLAESRAFNTAMGDLTLEGLKLDGPGGWYRFRYQLTVRYRVEARCERLAHRRGLEPSGFEADTARPCGAETRLTGLTLPPE